MYISESSLVWSNALVYLNISIKITSKESFYMFKPIHPCGLIFQRLSRSVEAGVPAGVDCAWKTWAIMRSLITAVTLQSNMPPVDNQKSQLFQPSVCFFIFCPVCLTFFRFVLRTKHLPDMYWSSHYPFLPHHSALEEHEIPWFYTLTVEWSHVGVLLTLLQVCYIKAPILLVRSRYASWIWVFWSPVLMQHEIRVIHKHLGVAIGFA